MGQWWSLEQLRMKKSPWWSRRWTGRFPFHLLVYAKCPGRRLLVLVPRVTSGSKCQVTFGVGWQLLGFSGMAKCGILATKGVFFSPFRSDLFLNSFDAERCSHLGRARARAHRGHRPRWLQLCGSHCGSEQIKRHQGRLLQGHRCSERL